MHNAGIEITVVCPADHPNYNTLTEAGVPTVDIRMPRNFDKEGIAALREELVRGHYHIMHTFNNKAVSNGLRACKGLPVKIVCYRGIVGAVGFLDPMSWMRYLNPRIDRIVCVAEAIRQYFLQMKPAFLRMPADRPVTIHKGHNLEWYTATPANLTDYGIPKGAFVGGCTANYRPRKGIDYLIDAIEALPGDVEVHLEREGLARAIIEAMAYRVPPVVTDAGGSPELVVDGVSGFVVPPRDAQGLADAIEKLYRDKDLRRRMGEAARERIATDFRNEDTVRKTIALYEELVPEPD
jgi:glycosyltransferase involved in cell wall biosynthesis